MKELSMYRQLVYLPYMTSYRQLVCGAVELDVFSQLTQPVTAAEKNGWNPANTENLLKGLYSIGYIRREGDHFCNTDDANKYLVRTSPEYMGAVLQFFGKLKAALNPGGVVLCLNEGIEADYSGPWEMVVGYMTYQMQGMPMGMIRGQVKQLAEAGGFTNVENRTVLLSTGTHDVNILRA